MNVKNQLSTLLPGINSNLIDKLLEIGTYKLVKNKEVVLASGNLKKNGFLILEGSVRGFVRNLKGQEKIVLIRSTGIFVADTEAVFNNKPQKLTIEAIEDTHIIMFKYDDFEILVKKHEPLLNMYLCILKEAIIQMRNRLDSMIVLSPEERYKELIISNPVFLKSAYSKYVANYLGITPVSLSRIIKRIKTN
jgi:CRP-like cAMP-binding protein